MQTYSKTTEIKKQLSIIKINLIVDLLACVPVLVIAFLSNSLVLISDLFDYIFTITTSAIAFIILKKSLKNNSIDYNYGIGKMESLSALITGSVMLIALMYFLYEAVTRIFETSELNFLFVAFGISVHTIAIGVDLYLWKKAYVLDKASKSPLMEAQWKVNLTNGLGSFAVVIALLLTYFFKDKYWSQYIDPVFAAIIILITGKSFLFLIKRALNDLLDKTIDEENQLIIIKTLSDYEDGYKRLYDIKSRKSGNKIFIEISLGFDPQNKIGEAMDISGRIKERLEYDIRESSVKIIILSLEEFSETLIEPLEMCSKPLSKDHLDECIEIAKSELPEDDIEKIKLELLGSIYQKKYQEKLRAIGISSPRYWVTLEDEKVMGFAGINYHLDDDDAIWGGWMARKRDCSKSKYKLAMAQFWKPFFEARQTGRKYLRIMTSTLPAEKEANKFYEKKGFIVYKRVPCENYELLYYQGDLLTLYEEFRNWKNKNKTDFCFRIKKDKNNSSV